MTKNQKIEDPLANTIAQCSAMILIMGKLYLTFQTVSRVTFKKAL